MSSIRVSHVKNSNYVNEDAMDTSDPKAGVTTGCPEAMSSKAPPMCVFIQRNSQTPGVPAPLKHTDWGNFINGVKTAF